MRRVVISDTSCLIALNRIQHLGLLEQVFQEVWTTPEVRDEYGADLPAWIVIHSAKNKKLKFQLQNMLDPGEASAIALACELQNSLLIIDEKKGRKIAIDHNIDIIGTLRILLLGKEEGIIKQIAPFVNQLRKSGFRFSKTIEKELLKEAGEN